MHISKFTATVAFVAGVLTLSWGYGYCLTCEECKTIEKSERAYSKEESEKTRELRAAFEKGDFEKVRALKARVTELRKQLMRWKATRPACRDACRPDKVKALECKELTLKIAKMESKSSGDPKETAQIDDLYRSLRRCHIELEKLTARWK